MRMVKLSAVCGLVGLAFFLGTVWSQDGQDGEEGGMGMPPWMQLTEQHKAMKKSAGDWKVAGNYWMGEGADATPMDATAERKMIMGDRFVQENFRCSFMGMPFEGTLIQGYDTLAKEHVNIWIDNMSPMISMSRGTEKDGVMTMKGKTANMMGEMVDTRTVIKVKGPDAVQMAMYESDAEGKNERKTMELNYTRKK